MLQHLRLSFPGSPTGTRQKWPIFPSKRLPKGKWRSGCFGWYDHSQGIREGTLASIAACTARIVG